jgi:hypothetical protein
VIIEFPLAEVLGKFLEISWIVRVPARMEQAFAQESASSEGTPEMDLLRTGPQGTISPLPIEFERPTDAHGDDTARVRVGAAQVLDVRPEHIYQRKRVRGRGAGAPVVVA